MRCMSLEMAHSANRCRLLCQQLDKVGPGFSVRGIGVLPVFAGLIGLLLLVGALAATSAREGR